MDVGAALFLTWYYHPSVHGNKAERKTWHDDNDEHHIDIFSGFSYGFAVTSLKLGNFLLTFPLTIFSCH